MSYITIQYKWLLQIVENMNYMRWHGYKTIKIDKKIFWALVEKQAMASQIELRTVDIHRSDSMQFLEIYMFSKILTKHCFVIYYISCWKMYDGFIL